MSLKLDRLHQWRQLIKTPVLRELDEVAAGREAEHFLERLVASNLRYKGAACFAGKRVPVRGERRRHEIDLVVLTRKQLHFIEVKNWSGELLPGEQGWIQRKRDGREITHPNLTQYNSRKMDVALDYLAANGVRVDRAFTSQKVIFMNSRLSIHPKIAADANVVPRKRLERYLRSQKGANIAERMLHSVVEACFDAEKGAVVIDGLFNAVTAEKFQSAEVALGQLRSWDRLALHGGRVLQGDALWLQFGQSKIDLKTLQAGERLLCRWSRNKVLSLIKSLATNRPLGWAILRGERHALHTDTAAIGFHAAGEPKPVSIPLYQVTWMERG